MKKTTIFIVTSLILILFIIALSYLLFLPSYLQNKYIAEHCPNYKVYSGFIDRADFIDCTGNIGIEKFDDENFYTIFNQMFKSGLNEQWSYFAVKNFVINSGEVYYIENFKLNEGESDYLSRTEWPDRVDKLSIYRKINGETAEFTLYKTFDEIPDKEKLIFDKLEKE